MNMKLLPIISIQYSANREWDYLNLSGGSCYVDVAPNSYNLFTGNYVYQLEGRIKKKILGVEWLTYGIFSQDMHSTVFKLHVAYIVEFLWCEIRHGNK